jgi:hypothetical protein
VDGDQLFLNGMLALQKAYNKNWALHRRGNVLLSVAYIAGPDGRLIPRLIAFVAQSGLDPSIADVFDSYNLHPTVIQALPGKRPDGDSEEAAAAFREDTAGQERVLGGQIVSVNLVWDMNEVCSETCAYRLNIYIGRGNLIHKNDSGFLDGSKYPAPIVVDNAFLKTVGLTKSTHHEDQIMPWLLTTLNGPDDPGGGPA